MAEWTKDQSDQITALYGQLKGDYEKVANQKLFGGEQLPYEEAHHTLMEILKKQEAEQHGGLEAKTNAAHAEKSATGGLPSLTRTQSAFGLATIAVLLGILASGPIGAVAGYKAAAAYAMAPVY